MNTIVSLYINAVDTYMEMPIDDFDALTQDIYFHLEACPNVNIDTITTETIECKVAKCLFDFIDLRQIVSISNITVKNLDAHGKGPAVMKLTGNGETEVSMTLITLDFISNADGYGSFELSNLKLIEMNNSTLSNIESTSVAGLLLDNVQKSVIYDVTMHNMSATTGSGGCFYIESSADRPDASVNFTDVILDGCSAGSKGGGVYLTMSAGSNRAAFSMDSVVFTENYASSGSHIFISDSFSFDGDAEIKSSTFKDSSAENSGGIYTNHVSGVLRITDSEFSGNSGNGNSVFADFSTEEKLMKLTDVRFLNNLSGSALYAISTASEAVIESENCTFSGNYQGVAVINLKWEDKSSTFYSNNRAFDAKISALLKFKDTTIKLNTAGPLGSPCEITATSAFTCEFCKFIENTSDLNGGAISIDSNSYAALSNCVFTSNRSGGKGSSLFINNNVDATTIDSTIFTTNSADEGGTIIVIEASISMENCTFSSNTAKISSSGVMLNAAEALISASNFHDQSGETGVFLYVTTGSEVILTGVHFYNGAAIDGGMIAISSSELQMDSCSIKDCSSTILSAGVYGFSGPSIIITSCEFSNLQSGDNSGGVYVNLGTLSIKDSHFSNTNSGGLILDSLDSLYIEGTTFSSGASPEPGGVIYAENVDLVQITTSVFTSISSGDDGGAIYIESRTVTPDSYIKSSTFTSNVAAQGGAICVINTSIDISANTFNSNSASVSGGAIFTICSETEHCVFNIENNAFQSNTANSNGGAIAWLVKQPTIAGNTFADNNATYGNDYASFAISIQEYTGRRLEGDDIVSGQSIDFDLILALVDHYGQVVTTAEDYSATLSTPSSGASLSGVLTVYSVAGIIAFVELTITAEPSTNVVLSVFSATLDTATTSDDDEPVVSTISIEFYSRECVVGEYFFNNIQCILCENGTYSVDPSQECTDCPSNAVCYGSFQIAPKPGYWRENSYSTTIYECYNADACLGGVWNDIGYISYTGECETGYRGHLCQPCDNGYSTTSKNQCGTCPEHYMNAFRLLGIVLIIIIVCVIMVRSSIRSAYQPKAIHSIYIKIFMNYLQLVMLTAQFRLDWPEEVATLLSVQETTGQVTDQLFSFDCFLETSDEDSYKNVFFLKLALMAFLPCLLAAAALLFWGIWACVSRDRSVLKKQLITTLCVLFFLVHPTITRLMFSMFSCLEIEGEYWLVENLDVKCWDDHHISYGLLVGLPSIIVWVIGVPMIILLVLYKRRRKLKKTGEKLKFGFLYNGYKLKHYYWEFVILYRKILIISCAVFLGTVSVPIQALLCFTILVISLHMQYSVKPFNRKELNRMEVQAIIVASITIYCGLFYLTNDLNAEAKLLFLLLIIIVNVYFLLYWLYHIFYAGLVMVSRFIPYLQDKIRDIEIAEKPLVSLITDNEVKLDEVALDSMLQVSSPTDFYKLILQNRAVNTPQLHEMSIKEDLSEIVSSGSDE